jgi:hydroxyacylglutathione hydrolase
VQVIDVRQPGEWEQAHIAHAVLKPLPKLTSMLEGIDPERPIAVHCKSGYRSSIASSLLKRAGFTQVMNVIGGIDAWKACELPVVPPAQEAASASSGA